MRTKKSQNTDIFHAVLQVLYEGISYPQPLRNFLETSEDKLINPLDGIPHDLILSSTDLMSSPFL